jgi:hypothetical protein
VLSDRLGSGGSGRADGRADYPRSVMPGMNNFIKVGLVAKILDCPGNYWPAASPPTPASSRGRVQDPSRGMGSATPDGTCDVLIPKDRYDPFAVLAMVEAWEA